MRNAREEFLSLVKDKEVLCATLDRQCYSYSFDDEEDGPPSHNLIIGFNEQQYNQFLESICFNYDNGYGSQELYGTVWFKDGSWAERDEYDGSEWWSLRSVPEIPKKLLIKQ